eukprot:scaffold497_cov368-Prasinococcus_capsulatus_cf.AAC.24
MNESAAQRGGRRCPPHCQWPAAARDWRGVRGRAAALTASEPAPAREGRPGLGWDKTPFDARRPAASTHPPKAALAVGHRRWEGAGPPQPTRPPRVGGWFVGLGWAGPPSAVGRGARSRRSVRGVGCCLRQQPGQGPARAAPRLPAFPASFPLLGRRAALACAAAAAAAADGPRTNMCCEACRGVARRARRGP